MICLCLREGLRPGTLTSVAMQVAVLVIGAGPTGLGAATRIHQHGLKDWLILDQVQNHLDPGLQPPNSVPVLSFVVGATSACAIYETAL